MPFPPVYTHLRRSPRRVFGEPFERVNTAGWLNISRGLIFHPVDNVDQSQWAQTRSYGRLPAYRQGRLLHTHTKNTHSYVCAKVLGNKSNGCGTLNVNMWSQVFSYPSRPGHGEGRGGRGQADGCDLLAAPPHTTLPTFSHSHYCFFFPLRVQVKEKMPPAEINAALSPSTLTLTDSLRSLEKVRSLQLERAGPWLITAIFLIVSTL